MKGAAAAQGNEASVGVRQRVNLKLQQNAANGSGWANVAHNAADTFVTLAWCPLCWDRVGGTGWLAVATCQCFGGKCPNPTTNCDFDPVSCLLACWVVVEAVLCGFLSQGLDSPPSRLPRPDLSGDPGIELTSGLVC